MNIQSRKIQGSCEKGKEGNELYPSKNIRLTFESTQDMRVCFLFNLLNYSIHVTLQSVVWDRHSSRSSIGCYAATFQNSILIWGREILSCTSNSRALESEYYSIKCSFLIFNFDHAQSIVFPSILSLSLILVFSWLCKDLSTHKMFNFIWFPKFGQPCSII